MRPVRTLALALLLGLLLPAASWAQVVLQHAPLDVTTQAASTTQTSADFVAPPGATGAWVVIDITAIVGTPDLDIEMYLVDPHTGKERLLFADLALAAVATLTHMWGGVSSGLPDLDMDTAVARGFPRNWRIKGVTDVGASTPTITYKVSVNYFYN